MFWCLMSTASTVAQLEMVLWHSTRSGQYRACIAVTVIVKGTSNAHLFVCFLFPWLQDITPLEAVNPTCLPRFELTTLRSSTDIVTRFWGMADKLAQCYSAAVMISTHPSDWLWRHQTLTSKLHISSTPCNFFAMCEFAVVDLLFTSIYH